MHVSALQVKNYKCFLDSGEVPLFGGMNVIVGRNDAGKSALIEALSLQGGRKPHRSLATVPVAGDAINTPSVVRLSLQFHPDEASSLLGRVQVMSIPQAHGQERQECVDRLMSRINESSRVVSLWSDGSLSGAWFEGFENDMHAPSWLQVGNSRYPSGFKAEPQSVGGKTSSSFAELIATQFSTRIYAFRAERLNVGECQATGSSILNPNASNLAEVLNLLISSNPRRFARYLENVRTVFPHIQQITAPLVSSDRARIMVWSLPSESERADLAVPLSESGTGIGQVLAILYVVMAAETPQLILIDEPQSFLHPGAVRKLIALLNSYPQHQYVLSTHSPSAVSSVESHSLIRIERSPKGSVVFAVRKSDERELRLVLADVGARLSDVFGVDRILWVEGKTEELCFPYVLQMLQASVVGGLQVIGVQSTADLEGRIAEKVFDIYSRVSTASAILPSSVAFILDRENRTNQARQTLTAKSKGRLKWLPRRMFENYLLDENSIAAVLTEEDKDRHLAVTAEDVTQRFSMHGLSIGEQAKTMTDQHAHRLMWERDVDAATVLADVFKALTEHRVAYDKVRHGVLLTRRLVDCRSTGMQELAKFLDDILANEVEPH